MRLLVTGGCGFIGSAFCRAALAAGNRVTVLDALTYAGLVGNLPPDIDLCVGDVREPLDVLRAIAGCDAVVHFAAETHVDKSLQHAGLFASVNVLGTQNVMEIAGRRKVRFLHISTDEVLGSLGPCESPWKEDAPLKPTNPYAASKAAAECLVMAAFRTHGQDVVVTRSGNNWGPRQHREKLIPKALGWQGAFPVHGDGKQIRDWIHVDDHCRALLLILDRGKSGEVYHVGARCEQTVLDVVERLGRDVEFVPDRPGQDHRYALDPSKVEALGWRPEVQFDPRCA